MSRRLAVVAAAMLGGCAEAPVSPPGDAGERPVPPCTRSGGLVVEPLVVRFGTVLLGPPREIEVRVTNDACVAARVRSVPPDPPFEVVSVPADFELGPGESITARVRYTPAEVLPEERGRWRLSTCASAACEEVVPISATPTNTALECTPPRLGFVANPGAVVTRSTRCRNARDRAVVVTGWSLAPRTTGALRVHPYDASMSRLAPRDAVEIAVDYTAVAGASAAGAVIVEGVSEETGRTLEPLIVELHGVPGGPDVALTPAALDFGEVAVGTTVRRFAGLSNRGDAPLAYRARVVGDGFALRTGASGSVAPGGSTLIEPVFAPDLEGPRSAALIVDSDDLDSPVAQVTLRGTGLRLPLCRYTVEPAGLRFGLVGVGRVESMPVRITSTGTVACRIGGLELAPDPAAPFRLAPGTPRAFTLSPGAHRTVVVEHASRSAEARFGKLTFSANSRASEALVSIAATDVASTFRITPDRIDFGQVRLGCGSRGSTITVENVGASPAAIQRTDLLPESDAGFALVGQPPNIVWLPPGGRFDFRVRYAPDAPGYDLGAVRVLEARVGDVHLVPLSGEGAFDAVSEERFTQVGGGALDVLLVVRGEHPAVVEALSRLLDPADAEGLDLRAGVIAASSRTVTTVGTPGALIAAAASAGAEPGPEMGLAAARAALTGGFFRAGARRLVVFASSGGDSADIPVSEVVQPLAAAAPWDAAIAAFGPAERYREAARATLGVAASASDDPVEILGELRRRLTGFRTRFPLAGTPVEGTLSVAGAPWRYDPAANSIESAPSPGTELVARYTAECSAR